MVRVSPATEILAYDLGSPDVPRRFPWYGKSIYGLIPSPDGRRLAILWGVAVGDGEVALWDADRGRELVSWETRKFAPTDGAFTPDGRMLIVAGIDRYFSRSSRLVVFDATPLDPRIEAFDLVRDRIGTLPWDDDRASRFAEAPGYGPDVFRQVREIAKVWPDRVSEVLEAARMSIDGDAGRPIGGDNPRIIGVLDRVIRQNPDEPEAWHQRGRALYRAERLGEARESLLKAIALAPDAAEAHADLALCEARLGRRAEAEKALADYLRLSSPANPAGRAAPLKERVEAVIRRAFGRREGPAESPARPARSEP
jgi:hypothetical protein